MTSKDLRCSQTMQKPLYLYLRPFESDGRIFVKNPRKATWWNWSLITYQASTPHNVNLEELLLRVVERHGLLIAIGRQTGLVGGGKVIASENDWKNYFSILAVKASCIFSVPSLNESTLWELQWLADKGLFERVLMLFTELHFDQSYISFRIEPLSKRLREMGWLLPTIPNQGALISFDKQGRSSEHIQRGGLTKEQLESIALSVARTF